MTYLSAAVTVGYVILYPLVVVLSWVLACLSPVIHLVHYLLHALFFPLRLLARFEVGSTRRFVDWPLLERVLTCGFRPFIFTLEWPQSLGSLQGHACTSLTEC